MSAPVMEGASIQPEHRWELSTAHLMGLGGGGQQPANKRITVYTRINVCETTVIALNKNGKGSSPLPGAAPRTGQGGRNRQHQVSKHKRVGITTNGTSGKAGMIPKYQHCCLTLLKLRHR